jgi:hypothetical protein
MKWIALICLVLLGRFWAWSQVSEPPKNADEIILRFSGYDWRVKTSRGSVRPGPNVFGANAVTVDPQGRLHLRVYRDGNRWVCGEVISRRNFGYGEYRFVVADTVGLDINTVLGLFTWDSNAKEKFFREADIEISRWGEENAPAGQFVIQPYVRPGNRVRFALPPGPLGFSFRWMPGRLLFRAVARGKVVHEHLFTKGVPEPDQENINIRLNMWQYRSLPPTDGKTVEAVIENFKFLP